MSHAASREPIPCFKTSFGCHAVSPSPLVSDFAKPIGDAAHLRPICLTMRMDRADQPRRCRNPAATLTENVQK
jgi:hypothetical protein